MKQGNILRKAAFYMVLTSLIVWLAGCGMDLEGEACEVGEDCASGVCSPFGLCVPEELPEDSDTGTESADPGAVDTGTVALDTGAPPVPLTGVDILFVVDNSGSMAQEQEILADSMGSLTEMLSQGVGGTQLDVRVAVATTDMGVSYDGGVYEDEDEMIFANEQVRCFDEGDNGAFLEEPYDCPEVYEFVQDPGYITPVNHQTGELNWNGFVVSSACMMANIGTDGCNYEQQLSSVTAAITDDEQKTFLRANAMTAIVLITDEEDCSIADPAWFELDELQKVTANLACGRHQDLLKHVTDLRAEIINAKTAATGVDATSSVMFTAIAGVPVGSVCEGRGDQIGDCMAVSPGVNGGGTMGSPDEVARMTIAGVEQYYFEYACVRYAESADPEQEYPITAAYPATRIVQLAQQFGDMGFVYSICNEDWRPVMTQLGTTLLQKMAFK